jgi:hypothetical protein
MSDLRASDRLLGVIGEEALAIDADIDAGVNIGALDLAMHSARIREAVAGCAVAATRSCAGRI